MIKYIQRKEVDFEKIREILSESFSLNHFTNMGPTKYSLERIIEKKLKIRKNKRVVALSNGTQALHALMLLYEFKSKRRMKWATPSFTFPSSVVGGFSTKIFDIELENYTLPLEKKNFELIDGIIITTLFGTYPNNIKEWISFCKENKKILIFDHASSPATEINGVNFCNLGDSSFGSLHHTKFLGFGEGGFAVVDAEDYEKINSIACFGFDGKTKERKFQKKSSNFKMPDTSAAFIIHHIDNYNLDKHIEIQRFLIDKISSIPGVVPFNYSEGVVYGNFPLLYEKPFDHLRFRDLGIESHKYYYPLKSFKNSNWLYKRIVNLPLHESLTDYEINLMISAIKNTTS
jgi:dTDP-4-amino-4,6-dideoxygalactose transaminase